MDKYTHIKYLHCKDSIWLINPIESATFHSILPIDSHDVYAPFHEGICMAIVLHNKSTEEEENFREAIWGNVLSGKQKYFTFYLCGPNVSIPMTCCNGKSSHGDTKTSCLFGYISPVALS